jgi:hypothetical protein
VLELFAEEPELLAVVDAVAATQRARRRLPRRPLVVLAATLGVAAAVIASTLAPWSEKRVNVVGEALAAVGDAPVLHSVVSTELSDDWRVNLATGQSQPVRVTVETFFDASRNQTRVVIRHEGVVVANTAMPAANRAVPGLTDTAGALFSTGYRAALAQPQTHVLGHGRFRGRAAIRLSVLIHNRRELVIIDAKTYRPVGFRQASGTPVVWTVDKFESVPRQATEFATHDESQPESGRVTKTRATSLAALRRQVSFRPVVAGPEFHGFRLRSVELQALRRAANSAGESAETGIALHYRGNQRTPLVIEEAAAPEPAYGFVRNRFTANLDPIPPNTVLDLMHHGDTWVGQTRNHGLFLRISSPQRGAVIAAARALRLLP